MDLGSIKDVVDDLIGRGTLPVHIMDYGLGFGRREIEKTANFYWMRSSKTWSMVVSQNTYSITTSSSSGLNLPNFKDVLAMFSSVTGSNQWSEVLPGDVFQLEHDYPTDGPGKPRFYVIDNTTLRLYPPSPDATYPMKMWHFEWTSNPTINSGANASDEITNRWPEALIYATAAWGFAEVKKDEAKAGYYKNPLRLEIMKIKDYNLDRMLSWRVDLTPHSGANTGRPFINANKSINPWMFGW